MYLRLRQSWQTVVIAQVLAALASNIPAFAGSVGTPPGGNRSPIDFIAGTPFSVSTWTPSKNAHIPGIANGKGLAKHGFALDLTSTAANIDLSHSLFHKDKTVTLNLDGNTQAFSAGMMVTAAEYIAILQTLTKSQLMLTLGTSGNATGGDFSLNRLVSPRITELEIPTGVVALDNMARNPLMGLAGDLLNFGTIYAYSTSRRIHTGLIYSGFGGSITNESGGLISTSLPSSIVTGRTLSSVNLVLAADDNLSNQGTIVGSGGLKLATAYGSISNLTLNTSSPATIQTVGNIQFIPGTTGDYKSPSGTANITNTGTVTSTAGNVTINSPLALADIYITGTGTATNGTDTVTVTGLFQANAGAINVRDSQYKGPANIILNGGDYEASNGFNMYGGFGNIIGDGTLAADSLGSSLQSSPISAGILSTQSMGSVSLVDQTTTGITVNASTAGSFSLATAGTTTLNSIATSDGDLAVVAATGTLQTLPAVQLSAKNGAIILQNLDDTNGKILIGTSSSLTTPGQGTGTYGSDVVLAVGSPISETNAVTGSIPNVTIKNLANTNTVYGGTNGFTANPGTNTLTLKSADIVFSTTGNATSGSITLNGSVDITAAPVSYPESADPDEEIVDPDLDGE